MSKLFQVVFWIVLGIPLLILWAAASAKGE